MLGSWCSSGKSSYLSRELRSGVLFRFILCFVVFILTLGEDVFDMLILF